jgi:hypothetical protein
VKSDGISFPQSQVGQWRVAGHSIRGASHARVGAENQDAIGWIPAGGVATGVVLSVADGHGSPQSFRSGIGARLAIDVSHALAAELLSVKPVRSDLSMVKDRLEREVPRRIVRQWRARVDEHLSSAPFLEKELAFDRGLVGLDSRERVEADPYLAYGSTLVTAIAAEVFMVFWQIGDGDVLTVAVDGSVGQPLPGEELKMGDETASLCSVDAWKLFRVAVLGTPAPALLVSTDGLANSFQDDAGFFRFGSDLFQMLITDGIEAVGGKLDAWLRDITRKGSGDDISLGVICRASALPSGLSEPWNIGRHLGDQPFGFLLEALGPGPES